MTLLVSTSPDDGWVKVDSFESESGLKSLENSQESNFLLEGEIKVISFNAKLRFPQMKLEIEDGTLYITNYKLFYLYVNNEGITTDNCTSVPLMSIRNVIITNGNSYWSGDGTNYVEIKSKDLRSLTFIFSNSDEMKKAVDIIESYCFF